MAITISIPLPTIDLETSIGTITDSSVYTSPTRPTVGVYIKLYKVDYAGGKSNIVLTSNTSDPNTDSSWTFNYPTDGWFQIPYVAIPDWAATTYAKYAAVFDFTNKIVYRSKVNSNVVTVLADLSNTTNWEVISDPAMLAFNDGLVTESLNITSGVLNYLIRPIILKNFGTQTGVAFLEASNDAKRSQDVRLYELLGLAVDALTESEAQKQYSLGEIFARRAIDLCSNC